MNKKALWKDIWKTIWNNKARFLALFAIIFLGVGFYAGISATGPDMLDTANRYYDEQKLFDLRVLSTFGIEEDDADALQDIDNLILQPVRTVDAVITEQEYLIRLFPYVAENQAINDFQVIEGRLPEKEGEVALDATGSFQRHFSIGDEISFQMEETEEIEDEEEVIGPEPNAIKKQTYIVVGFVHSPLYIEEMGRGNSQVGKGSLDGFGVVFEEDLTGEIYTEMYVRFENQRGLDAYTDEYREYVAAKKEEIEIALNGRPMERINEIRAEGRKEIFEGRKELEDARQQLADAEAELVDANNELDDARAAYEANKAAFDAEITAAEQEIANQQAIIDQGWEAYKQGLTEWEAGTRQYADAKTAWDIEREVFLQRMDGPVSLEELASNPIPTPEGEELAAQIQYLLNGEEDIERARNQLANFSRTLDAQEAELEAAQAQLDADKLAAEALANDIPADQATLSERQEALAIRQPQLELVRTFLTEPFEELTEARIGEMRAAVTAQGDVTSLYQPFLRYLNGEVGAGAVPVEAEQATQNQLAQEIAQLQTTIAEKEAAIAAYQIQERERALLEQGQLLETAKRNYGTNIRDLDVQAQALQRAKNVLQNEIEQSLQGIRGQVAAADQQFVEQAAALQNAYAELEASRRELEEGQIQLDNARQELTAQKAEGETALADALAQIEAGEAEYAEGLAAFEAERTDAEQELRDAEVALDKAVDELRRLDEPVYFVQNRTVNPGYEGYGDNANRISAIASIFPVFFFLIAALISFTTMTRMVDEQRQQMGTLKGLGYSNGDIANKFLVYAGIACVTGTVLGLLFGYHLFPSIIYTAYSSLYNLPDIQISYYWSFSLISFVVALLCTVGPALLAASRTLRESPASLMRPKAPKKGKRVFLERIPWFWNRLGFNAKITVRNLARYKVRNSMTVIGVAGCMALILTGFAVKNSISGLADRQFDDIMQYDAIVALQPDLRSGELTAYQEEIESYPEISENLQVLQASYRAEKSGISSQDVNIFVPTDPAEIANFVRLQNRGRSEQHTLSDEGAIISEKLAILLEVQPGDEVVIQDDEEMTYRIPIEAVTENYTGHYLYLTPNLYEEIFSQDFVPNVDLVNYEAGDAWEAEFAENMMGTPYVSLMTFMDTVDRAFADTLASLDVITIVLIVSAAALAFVVLYNLTNINVSERIRELSTIKVLGFYPTEVSLYIYRETLILTIIGILFGFVSGNALSTLLLKMVEVDFMLFPITILPASYIYSTLLTLTFSIIVMLIMHVKLKRVDMLEALKSVE